MDLNQSTGSLLIHYMAQNQVTCGIIYPSVTWKNLDMSSLSSRMLYGKGPQPLGYGPFGIAPRKQHVSMQVQWHACTPIAQMELRAHTTSPTACMEPSPLPLPCQSAKLEILGTAVLWNNLLQIFGRSFVHHFYCLLTIG